MADGLHERVNADLAEGRLWKARDRLQGARRMDPTNQWILETLGEVYFRMGDLPEAGRAWFLTARTGPDCKKRRRPSMRGMGTAHKTLWLRSVSGVRLTTIPSPFRSDSGPSNGA